MEQSDEERLRREYSALKEKADAQMMQLIGAESRIVALQIENDGLREENQRLKNADAFTDSTVETVTKLHRQFLGASAELSSSRNEVESLKHKLDEKARRCDETSRALRQSTERCEGLVRQVLDANSALIQAKSKVARLETEKEALSKQLHDAEVQLKEADTTVESLNQELDEARKESEMHCLQVEVLREQIHSLEASALAEPSAKPDGADVDLKQKQEEILAAISAEFGEVLQSVHASMPASGADERLQAVDASSPISSADDSGVASDSPASPVADNA